MSFKTYLEESEVNSHMTHLSDMVFINGVAGVRVAINYLSDMIKLFGETPKNIYSVKWDGAPSVVIGIDPTDKQFFVAKKGIFNATPKVYKTQADIDSDLSGELRDKFTIMLKELPKLGLRSGIYQGDLMYISSDLKYETIDGIEMVLFHPNTIAYAVPKDSDLGRKVIASKLGIVFHTTYSGSSFQTLKASFGKNITDKFVETSSVWAIDATLDNQTSNFSLSDTEYIQANLLLKDIGIQFHNIPSAMLNQISSDAELQSLVLIFINSLVRKNVRDLNSVEMSNEFYKFIDDRYTKTIDALKKEKSKNTALVKKERALEFFRLYSHSQIAHIFEIAKLIDMLKDLLLTKMRKINNLSHFVKTKDGYRVTNPEGFVAIAGDTAIKLVDRFEFSAANFSSEIIKGWTK